MLLRKLGQKSEANFDPVPYPSMAQIVVPATTNTHPSLPTIGLETFAVPLSPIGFCKRRLPVVAFNADNHPSEVTTHNFPSAVRAAALSHLPAPMGSLDQKRLMSALNAKNFPLSSPTYILPAPSMMGVAVISSLAAASLRKEPSAGLKRSTVPSSFPT